MATYPAPYEVLADGSHGDLILLGEAQSYNEDGTIDYGPLEIVFLSDTAPLPQPPPSPFLTATQPSRTEIDLQWVPATQGQSVPPVTQWALQRRSSTDDGATFGAWAAVSGSPFAAATLTKNDTGLSTGTPEVVFQYRVAGINTDVLGDLSNAQWSNVVAKQWQGSPVPPPTAPTNFTQGTLYATHVAFTWDETPDASVTKHGLWQGGTLVVDNIDRSATTFNWTGLVPGSPHTNVRIARANITGVSTVQWSPLSNSQTFTLPPTDPPTFTTLMGVSNSDENHGGFSDWDYYRAYNFADAKALANVTGANHPQRLGVTDGGAVFSGYTNAKNALTARLEDFYYGTGSGARSDVGLDVGNGNEYGDKVAADASSVSAFAEGCRGYRDAARTLNSDGVTRRYPLVKVGLDPTHFQEQKGTSLLQSDGSPAASIAVSLGAAARYLDFVAWSMYPPGRENTVDDPTFTKPSLLEADRTKLQAGFLVRCFYRTYQAQLQARSDTGNPNYALEVGCWEVGIGNDPDYDGHRPYYAVHSLIGTMTKLAQQYGLVMPFACWWDQQLTKSGVLQSDNPFSHEPASTTPSTAVAWRTWKTLNHEFGGTHPASWAGYPVLTGTNPWKGGA